MRILLLGATGPVGIVFLHQGLERNHTVVVYARSPNKIPLDLREHPSINVSKGSLEDVDLIRQAFSVEGGIDAVVSALGPPVTWFHPKDAPIARAYETVFGVMREKGVKRIIVLGTASIKDPLDKPDLQFKAMITTVATFAPYAYHDVLEIGRVFATLGDDLDWTIARVPIFIPSENRFYRAGHIGEPTTGHTLTREGFVAFVLDELVSRSWVKKRPMLSGA